MFKLGDYIDRVPIYLPRDYDEFEQLPPEYDPYTKKNEDDEPSHWVLMISGKSNRD